MNGKEEFDLIIFRELDNMLCFAYRWFFEHTFVCEISCKPFEGICSSERSLLEQCQLLQIGWILWTRNQISGFCLGGKVSRNSSGPK